MVRYNAKSFTFCLEAPMAYESQGLKLSCDFRETESSSQIVDRKWDTSDFISSQSST